MSKLELHVHLHHHHDGLERSLARLLDQSDQILKETKQMPSYDEVKAAVDAAAQKAADDIKAAVQKETAEVVAQIQAIPVGAVFTQEQADALVASVAGIGTGAVADVDTISQNDGGAQATT